MGWEGSWCWGKSGQSNLGIRPLGIPSEAPSQALTLLLQHLRQGSGDKAGKNTEQPQMHLEELEGEAQICPRSDPGSAQGWECTDTVQCPPSLSGPGGCACPQHPHRAGLSPHIGTSTKGTFERLLCRKSSLFALLFPLGLKLFSSGWKHGMFVKFMRAFRETFRKNILSLLL